MKFDTYATNSRFTETFTKRERTYFERAFNPRKITKGSDKDKRVIDIPFMTDRKWVEEVLELFAERMRVSVGQVIQSFKSGSFEALQRVHTRVAENLSEGERENHVSAKMASLQPNDFAQSCRAAWSWALDCRHPDDSKKNAA